MNERKKDRETQRERAKAAREELLYVYIVLLEKQLPFFPTKKGIVSADGGKLNKHCTQRRRSSLTDRQTYCYNY